MENKTLFAVSGTFFLVFMVLHLLRSMYGWEAQLNGLIVPLWVSYLVVPVAGLMAYLYFTAYRKKR